MAAASKLLLVVCLLGGSTVFAQPRDEDFLPVPGGRRFHKSCVHKLPDGALLEGRQVSVGGINVEEFPACAFSPRDRHHDGPLPWINGWMLWGQRSATPIGGIAWFNDIQSRWTVPTAPNDTNPHTIFLFPGFQGTGGHILQPVLQFGTSAAGGGAFWAMANWIVGPDIAAYSTLQSVSVGSVITGRVQVHPGWSCPSNGIGCHWQVEYKVNGGSGVATVFWWGNDIYNLAFGAALEVYNLGNCNQLPHTSGVVFTHDWLFQAGPTAFTKNAINTCYSNGSIATTPECSKSVSNSCTATTMSWVIP